MRVCNRRTCPIGIKSIAVDRPSTTRTHPPWHAFEPRATLSWRKMGCHSSQKCWEDNRILGNSASHSSSKHQPTINLPSTPHHRSTRAPGLLRACRTASAAVQAGSSWKLGARTAEASPVATSFDWQSESAEYPQVVDGNCGWPDGL